MVKLAVLFERERVIIRMKELLISGYSSNNSTSIAKFKLLESAQPVWADTIHSPSFLAVYEDICFAISEKEKGGEVFCYKKAGEGYIQTDSIYIQGGLLCHICYSPKNNTLYGASYASGRVIAIAVDNYKFVEILHDFVLGEELHTLTRAHCCLLDRDESRLLVTNIALDRVYCYDIQDGYLTANKDFPFFQLEAGNGPRHAKMHPYLDIFYIITEYSNVLFTVKYNVETGEMNVLQKISTLPDAFDKESYGSSLVISADGKHLYAANRGANTIAVFTVQADGIIEKIQDFDCYGDWPRHIDLSNDGKFLMVANQQSDTVAIISVSATDGTLQKECTAIPFVTPSYIKDITTD